MRIDWKRRELYSKLLAPDFFILRIDGRNFKNVLRDFEKPYDLRFTKAMVETCRDILTLFNPAFAYTFSDEVSFLFCDLFGNRVEKIDSIVASEFSSRLTLRLKIPLSFDARVIHTGLEDVCDYLRFRQEECWRNHMNSYVFYTLLKEFKDRKTVQEFLKGKKSSEIHEILFKRGINLSKTPAWQRRGVLVHWKVFEFEKEFEGKVVKYKRRKIVENWSPPIFDNEEGKGFVDDILKDWIRSKS